MICPYCNIEFAVPEGKRARIERTCDMPPPARAAAVLWDDNTNRPDFSHPPLHYCERGVPKEMPL